MAEGIQIALLCHNLAGQSVCPRNDQSERVRVETLFMLPDRQDQRPIATWIIQHRMRRTIRTGRVGDSNRLSSHDVASDCTLRDACGNDATKARHHGRLRDHVDVMNRAS